MHAASVKIVFKLKITLLQLCVFLRAKKLEKQKVLVVGLGEIGRPLFELLKESGCFQVYGLDVDEKKMAELKQNVEMLPQKVDILHICIPYQSKAAFIDNVVGYAKKYQPKLLIINSTVPPKTTTEISKSCKCLISHSPIFGTHKNLDYMKWEIRRWTKLVGAVDAPASEATCKHFAKAGINCKVLKSPIETELAKLFETIYSAWMIIFFQEMHRISKHFGADLDAIAGVIEQIHRVRLDRPLWYPGVIGGHCLIPNTELLLKSYDSEFLRLILKSNEKRKEEIKDKSICEEMEKIKRRAEALQKDLMKLLENSQEKSS
ncbi:MAG: NAD(P)-dependent oxidoreductase [Candidatus Bathyarchaeia archaeon]